MYRGKTANDFSQHIIVFEVEYLIRHVTVFCTKNQY